MSAVAYALLAIIAIGVAAAAVTYQTGGWPAEYRRRVELSESTAWMVAGGAAVLAVLFLIAVAVNARRWRTARFVRRLSSDPTLAPILPDCRSLEVRTGAIHVPLLDLERKKSRKLKKPEGRLRSITPQANVAGRRPLQILYLRLFENQPRMRTFVQGAWREFGYVHLLRSAASVTPAELKWARRSGRLNELFVSSTDRLLADLDGAPELPIVRRRNKFTQLGATAIRVRDRYGSYPVRSVLCHGNYWKDAIDMLLDRMDLVVLDLSGYGKKNAGTRHELQCVIDRIPIERVLLLADQRSKMKFLRAEVQRAWSLMTPGSPNAHGHAHSALIAVTDYFISQQQQTHDGHTETRVRLVARRRQTRRVAAEAQRRIDQHFGTADVRVAPDERTDCALVVEGGHYAGGRLPLESQPRIIGRDPACDLVLSDPTVSAHHLQARVVSAGVIEVVDLGSTNGTWVNGRRIVGPTRLNVGGQINAGQNRLSVRLVQTNSSASKRPREPYREQRWAG